MGPELITILNHYSILWALIKILCILSSMDQCSGFLTIVGGVSKFELSWGFIDLKRHFFSPLMTLLLTIVFSLLSNFSISMRERDRRIFNLHLLF